MMLQQAASFSCTKWRAIFFPAMQPFQIEMTKSKLVRELQEIIRAEELASSR
jgi:hypothetical protein